MDGDLGFLGVLCASAAVKFAVLLRAYRRRPTNAEPVGRLSHINIYPVKSCRGVSLQNALCTNAGLQTGHVVDRHFVVTDEKRHFVSQRKLPRMALIAPSIHGDRLHVDAPGMETLDLSLHHQGRSVDCTVFDSVLQGVYCGDEAADWFSRFLGQRLRLYYTNSDIQTRNLAAIGQSRWHQACKPQDKVGFQDFGPYLLATESSLGDLNDRLDVAVDMRRFRPNLVIEGTRAFEEDYWTHVFIGDEVRMSVLKPCDRCVLTTVNPDEGAKDPAQQPLQTLKGFRIDPDVNSNAPLFGIHPMVDLVGRVKVGDPVFVVRGPAWWRST